MPQHIDSSNIAPCGINCDSCDIHLQGKVACQSCLKACGNKSIICEKCDIAMCARGKGFSFCIECEDFPCAESKNMDLRFQMKYQVSSIARSNLLKEIGMDAYLEEIQ